MKNASILSLATLAAVRRTFFNPDLISSSAKPPATDPLASARKVLESGISPGVML